MLWKDKRRMSGISPNTKAIPRHIGPGDPELFRDLPLRVFLCSKQSISHSDHSPLHLRKFFLICLVQDPHILPDDHRFKNFPVSRLQNIQEAHGLPIFICTNGIVDGNFSGNFFSSPEHHQNFICYPPPNAFLMH